MAMAAEGGGRHLLRFGYTIILTSLFRDLLPCCPYSGRARRPGLYFSYDLHTQTIAIIPRKSLGTHENHTNVFGRDFS